ncbi:MAG: hypothetical protein HYY16_19805 [Planctomycetes bacterium]|nr:hypothetical protein [Planctomycetota bacterium]
MERRLVLLGSLVALTLSCRNEGHHDAAAGRPEGTPLVLSAGVKTLDPAAMDTFSQGVDLGRLNIESVSRVYDLTTPADQPFAFSVLTRAEGNTGTARLSLAHVSDAGTAPAGGVQSIAEAGIVPSATGSASRGDWLEVSGDGFARLTLQGAVACEQVLAVRAETAGIVETALVRLGIGAPSEINIGTTVPGDYGGVLESRTLYSSDSWSFALPTVAVSGDRTSIVCYEGDRADPRNASRYEMRLQYDRALDRVTGGGSEETSPDSGNWRDHEIAALYNVLVLVHSGTDRITAKLSFDRGATFSQTETVGVADEAYRPRLVQTTMALDYTLALVFWRTNKDRSSDLVLVEAAPSAFDGGGSPTAFAFRPAEVVFHHSADVTPALMGIAYSAGGDLVIGYGFTVTTTNPDRRWTNLTQYRCATRLHGSGFADTLVEEDRITGMDPSVAVKGQGSSLAVFYAYEARDGIRMRTSVDAGRSFSEPVVIGDGSPHLPSVFVRDQMGQTRVDLLYLRWDGDGTELHLRHWDDYGNSAAGDYALTVAKAVESNTLPPGTDVPGATLGAPLPIGGLRITQIGWFGYDATLDGDDIVVAYDEQTYDAYYICILGGPAPMPALGGGMVAAPAPFVPATPPPLAPGMTEAVDPPNPDHMHQLKYLRLD